MKNTGIRTDIHPDTESKPMKLERWVERGPIDALADKTKRKDLRFSERYGYCDDPVETKGGESTFSISNEVPDTLDKEGYEALTWDDCHEVTASGTFDIKDVSQELRDYLESLTKFADDLSARAYGYLSFRSWESLSVYGEPVEIETLAYVYDDSAYNGVYRWSVSVGRWLLEAPQQ